jgi:integrase
VPLTPRLREAIRDHAADYRLQTDKDVGRSPWVLHHDVKRRHAKAAARVTSFRRGFANAAERAELPADLHQHDLRHRRVTKWLAAGKSPVLVQKAMGHSDLRVTLGYTHLVPEDLLQLVEDAPKAQRVS